MRLKDQRILATESNLYRSKEKKLGEFLSSFGNVGNLASESCSPTSTRRHPAYGLRFVLFAKGTLWNHEQKSYLRLDSNEACWNKTHFLFWKIWRSIKLTENWFNFFFICSELYWSIQSWISELLFHEISSKSREMLIDHRTRILYPWTIEHLITCKNHWQCRQISMFTLENVFER